MKKLDNIVVESLNREHGEEIIIAFRDLGIDTVNKQGFCCNLDGDIDRYYGIIKGEFSNYTIRHVKESFAKIITLEHLKAMKEDKSGFPKLMWVGQTKKELIKKHKREVLLKDNDGYWGRIIDEPEKALLYKYAQDIEETPGPKQEEVSVIINGIEYVPKK